MKIVVCIHIVSLRDDSFYRCQFWKTCPPTSIAIWLSFLPPKASLGVAFFLSVDFRLYSSANWSNINHLYLINALTVTIKRFWNFRLGGIKGQWGTRFSQLSPIKIITSKEHYIVNTLPFFSMIAAAMEFSLSRSITFLSERSLLDHWFWNHGEKI